MNRWTLGVAALLVVAAATLATACGDGGGADGREAFFTIEQSDGVMLTLEAAPQRIVSMSAHATEVLCAIGAAEQVVAVEQYANCPLGSDAKPAVDAFAPNVEAIADLEPDLVYISTDTDGIAGALREIEIPLLFLELPLSLDGTLEQIEVFGELTGHEDRAGALVDSMRERMDAVASRLEGVAAGPRVFHELDPLLFTAAPSSFVGDFYTFLKAENIAAGAVEDYPQLSAEVVIERDPEVVILADEAAGETPETVAARPGWDVISAVQNGRICAVDPDIVSRPGPRIVEALESLAACLYPDLFP